MIRWGAEHFGVATAREYYEGLLRVLDLLGDAPRIAREVGKGMRAHPYRSHVVIYRENEDTVEILGIRHGRSNWRRHL
jgi:toxin ParE1/3/4